MEYTMLLEKYTRDLIIAVGVLVGLSVAYAVVQTWSWTRRAGKLMCCDCVMMVKFVVFACGNAGTAIFVVVLGWCTWSLILFKVCLP